MKSKMINSPSSIEQTSLNSANSYHVFCINEYSIKSIKKLNQNINMHYYVNF